MSLKKEIKREVLFLKNKRLLYLILPLAILILEILPYGAVCNFANSEGEPIRMIYSYFSLTPFGYANFAPFLTALASCVLLVLLLGFCFAKKKTLLQTARVTNAIAFALSVCPLLLGVRYYSAIGALITGALGVQLILLLFAKKNAR